MAEVNQRNADLLLLAEEDHQSAHNGDGNGDDPIGAQRAEEGVAGSGQRAIDQGADNGAGENIAEVTAGHADGGKELGQDRKSTRLNSSHRL